MKMRFRSFLRETTYEPGAPPDRRASRTVHLRALPGICLLSGVAILFGTGDFLRGQSPAAVSPSDGDTVIRSETRVVLIDAVAVDKKGKFARDLTDKDFKLWEDGKEQKITSFALESAAVSPERANKHYVAMFFDTSAAGQTGQLVMRQESARFLDGFASPDRYMAVVYYGDNGGSRVAQNFTTDAALLKKALGTIQGSASSTPTLAQVGSTNGTGAKPSPSGATNVEAFAYRNMLASLRGVVDSLATIRGRKALVFFSGNASVNGDISADLTATLAACNKANVAVYTVGGGPGSSDGSGVGSISATSAPAKPSSARGSSLSSNNPLQSSESTSSALNSQQSIPLALSSGTGGISFLTVNDLANSLGQVAAEQDEYYLLGYTPTTEWPEDTCHELRLKVGRSDLEVRARKSYCTSKPVDSLSGKPAGKDLETRAASGNAGNIAARMQLPWFYSEPNVARVKLAIDLAPPPVKFQKDKGKLRGELDLAAVASRPDGSVAARFSDAVKLDFDNQQQADAFLKSPYHYENQLDVAAGQYSLRMAVSTGDQGFGKVEMPLKIDAWNGQTLSASGIALSRNAHASADLAAGLDGSLLERSRPLVANGTEVVPSGSSQFQAGERGFFYLEAYEPLLASVKAGSPLPLIGLRIRVLERTSGQQKQDSGVKGVGSFMRPGNPIIPIVSPLPTATLPAGAYRLEVSVMRQTGDPVVRTADFDVN